jgi:hypothetical protein
VWQKVANYRVTDCPEYLWELDEHLGPHGEQMLFVHLKVRKWSKATLLLMRERFLQFREFVTCPLYAVGEDAGEKYAKFVKHFGFEPLTEVICENGERRRLFISVSQKKKEVDVERQHVHREQDGEPQQH